MFKKLLSNLPFNPSLITEVSFYAKRLNKETSLRKLGFVFVALTMVVQVIAVASPAEASNKCSNNDIVRCGFTTRSQAVQQCNSNTQGFKTILNYYGISCDTVASAGTQTVKTNSHNNQLYSMGRNPYQKPGEYATSIPGAGTFYLRPVSSWNTASFKMLVMETPDRKPFMIMYDCSNIVILNGYTPQQKEPEPILKINKVNEPAGTVKPGDTIKYTIAFTNTGGTVAFFSVNDQLSPELEFVSSNTNGWPQEVNGQIFKWYNNTPPYYTFGNTDVFGTPGFITLTAKVKSDIKSDTHACNTAWLGYLKDGKPALADKKIVCNKVEVPCPEGTIKQPDGTCKKPEVPCPEGTIKQPDGTCKKPEVPCPEGTIKQPDGSCKTPEKEKYPIITLEKKAKNLTQNIKDANETTANGGDVIEYTLITKNYGTGEAKDTYLRSEELADILEYATLDLNSLNGAIFDQDTNTLAWTKPVNIKPNQAITKTFKVTIKNPIPRTPSPVGNPGSFDLKMTNIYGNKITIKLPASIEKTSEQVATTLPNTGPGEALLVGGVLTTIVGYFFARSRLMVKELELVKQEYTTGN